MQLIQRDHIRSDKLGPLCLRVSYGFCKEYETFLRAVLEKNPHKKVQAAACLSLGHFLNNRLQRLDLCREQPNLAEEFAALYGKEYLAKLQETKRAEAIKEVEAVFEQAAEKYGDDLIDLFIRCQSSTDKRFPEYVPWPPRPFAFPVLC